MKTPKTLLALAGIIGAAALAGCAPGTADEIAAEGAGAVSDSSPSLSAKITTRTISNFPDGEDLPTAPGCHVDVDRPVVEVTGNAAATNAIMGELLPPQTEADICMDYGDLEGARVTIEGAYHVGANAMGLLSLNVTEDSYMSGAAHPNHYEARFNFDLRTGAPISLADVLEPAALARVTRECFDGGTPFAESDDEKLSICGSLFLVEREGIRVFSSKEFRWDPEGVLYPWNELEGQIKPGVVRDFAKSTTD